MIDNLDLKEYRKKLKKYHLCRDCKKQDAYTLSGRTYCADCAEKMRNKKSQWRGNPDNRSKANASKRQQIERYKREGKCVKCGKPALQGKTVCATCLYYYRRKAKKDVNPRGENDICYQCNKRPAIQGKKLCAECYKWKLPISMANLQKAHDTNKNHWWRFQNAN